MRLSGNDDLPNTLYQGAWAVREKAWAPYSKFKVGAALYLPQYQSMVLGVNVENASFGATICAERGAVLSALAQYGKTEFGALLVATDADTPAVPCAECLQVLAEFCVASMPIYLANRQGIVETLVFADLLPRPFTVF